MNHRLLVLVTVLATTGCFSPYLKRSVIHPTPKPSPALVAGFFVHFNDGGGSPFGAAIDAAQNAGLDVFGRTASEMLAQQLARRGYTAAWDGPRTARLDAVQVASNAGTAALMGQWRHPDSSAWGPQSVASLFVKPADLIAKLTLPNATIKEYYAFVDIGVAEGGFIMREPVIIVRAAVYDAAAVKVFDLCGLGTGASAFLVADRSPGNLQTALQRAFDSLETVAEQPL